MTYRFEDLGDERFQQLCQAILAITHPNVQCLPVGQPDGGRDAFLLQHFEHKSSNLVVFQVKFVRDSRSREARDIIEQVIKTEGPKVQTLIERGASKYYLLTNVAGTSHLDVGSVDKVNTDLKTAFGIDAYCWWADDLARRIDAHPNLRWSYPEILRATDLLEALTIQGSDKDAERRANALRAYMAHQARYDAQLKFKQIDLQKSITELFVDVPARVINPPEDNSASMWARLIDDSEPYDQADAHSATIEWDDKAEQFLARAPGTLQLLMSNDFSTHFPQVVIEGAPGQGKSTVTQYLCQLHRFVLLNRHTELSRVGKNRPTAARVPFRVDLRDYASWIVGRDPFSDDPEARLPVDSSPVLESFLTAQIRRCTGMNFSVDDMTAVAQNSQILIVLDGFDEVADIAIRNRIVAEVSDASARIIENAISAQIIVTSRPAAFANSPGFSRDEWQHVEILSLSRPAIESYAEKWLDGRETDAREKQEVLRVLQNKLRQPYVRDLARNPMQLAILLALISVQGASLPDKRTALYDNYIDIFLNRESEKSAIVRDHRELLVQIHRYLAWTLQVEAETNSGAGNIAEGRLRDTLRAFLERSGHETKLVDKLFTGMVERVVALVSRVQGTFEFEVQPLREYFAARYLYDTAPYAPTGRERRGTLPDRFDAIARNFYWLNVARFYAGCYNTGELASLLDGLEDLQSADQFKFISNVPQLGATLLSDYVFSQQPKLAANLASRVTVEPRFRILLANRYLDHSRIGLSFPDGPARTTLVDLCKYLIAQSIQPDTIHSIAETLIANCSSDEIREYWKDLREKLKNDQFWLQLGGALRVFTRLPLTECVDILASHGNAAAGHFIRFGRMDAFDATQNGWNVFFETALDSMYYTNVYFGPRDNTNERAAIANALLAVVSYLSLHASERLDKVSFERFYYHRAGRLLEGGSLGQVIEEIRDEGLPAPRKFVEKIVSVTDGNIDSLANDLSFWSEFVELGREIWGNCWQFYIIAIAAAKSVHRANVPECGLVDESVPLCERAVRARLNAAQGEWWLEQFRSAHAADGRILAFAFLALHSWMPVEIMLQHSEAISIAIDSVLDVQWRILGAFFRDYGDSRNHRSRPQRVSLKKSQLPAAMSPRLACLLVSRVTPATARQIRKLYFANYDGEDRCVLATSSEISIEEAYSRANHWPQSLPAVARAYRHGVIPYRSLHREARNHDLPISEARYVCANAELYPLRFVGYAERILAAQTGAEAIPVGKIAARDEWFIED